LAALAGVVGGVGVPLLAYAVFPSSRLVTLVVPVLAGGLIGAFAGWAAGERSGTWPSLVGVAAAVAIVVVPSLLDNRQNWLIGTVVWAVVLVPVLGAAGVLARRGARLAGAVTAVIGGLLAVDAGVTSSLAWLLRELGTFEAKVWLWFLYSFDGTRHSFPNTLDLADEVSFWPHGLIAATAFAVGMVLVTQRVAALQASPA
jgi:hypothetical protein